MGQRFHGKEGAEELSVTFPSANQRSGGLHVIELSEQRANFISQHSMR